MIGALSHPGSVALWRPSAIDAGERPHIEHGLANQVAGLHEALSHFQVDSGGIVRFEGWGTQVDVPVPVLRQWLGEYAVTWGWRIGAPTDTTHQARLLVLHGSGRWSPGGSTSPASR